MSPRQLYALMDLWPNARFANVYGPAEVNQCTHFEIPKPSVGTADGDLDRPIPLGRIWEETDGIIIDEYEHPVTQGQAGELAIHSPTMMQGYWAQPDLNKKAFLVSAIDGIDKKFYKTGDLVKISDDNNLIFLGRKDRQVKLRGYRIELDEIENLLACYPQVEESAVFITGKSSENPIICASIIKQQGASLTPDELLKFLSEKLPWYSIPATITFQDSFPRTATGKIDRRKLQQLAELESDSIPDPSVADKSQNSKVTVR